MTGAEFLAYVKRYFKRTDKDTELYEAMRDAIMEMRLNFDYDENKVEAYSVSLATVGDYKVDLPSDFQRMTGAVRCYEDETNAKTLIKVSKARFDDLYPNPNDSDTVTAFPTHYCIYGQQMLVGHPVDKATYTIEFSYATEDEDDIESTTESVPFTDRYRVCLRYGVLKHLFIGLDDDEKAAKYSQLFEQEQSRAIALETGNSSAVAAVEYSDI
jgi:hypothetical protein